MSASTLTLTIGESGGMCFVRDVHLAATCSGADVDLALGDAMAFHSGFGLYSTGTLGPALCDGARVTCSLAISTDAASSTQMAACTVILDGAGSWSCNLPLTD